VHVGLYKALKGRPSFHRRRGDAIAKILKADFGGPQRPSRLRFAAPGRRFVSPASLSAGRIGGSFCMSMIRSFGVVASLLLVAFSPVAPATAGRIVAEERPQPFILDCFDRYTGAFLHWGMCADYQFPCRRHRTVRWRHPDYFMPHYCSPGERYAS
jgi:hypothetical protein